MEGFFPLLYPRSYDWPVVRTQPYHILKKNTSLVNNAPLLAGPHFLVQPPVGLQPNFLFYFKKTGLSNDHLSVFCGR